MPYDSATLKQIIQTFVEEHKEKSTSVKGTNQSQFLANSAIFEIESFLVDLRKQNEINSRLDTTIRSASILSDFKNTNALAAHQPENFQYSFLHYLARVYTPKAELFQFIDGFVEEVKDQFVLADIVITNSGATRCKTNIRFALNTLRNFGLVLSKDADEKRSWSPSILGLVTLLNIEFNKQDPLFRDKYRPPSQLGDSMHAAIFGYSPLDWLLLNASLQFKQPDYLYCFLNGLLDISLNTSEKQLIQKILEDFIEFTQEGLEITANGVKLTKAFKQSALAFQEKLFTQQKGNPDLQDKLFAHFRNV